MSLLKTRSTTEALIVTHIHFLIVSEVKLRHAAPGAPQVDGNVSCSSIWAGLCLLARFPSWNRGITAAEDRGF